jgi:hypothetical protein
VAGFATYVSSSGTALAQIGVANALANAANLATLSTGTALATTPASNGTVPQAEINTLANVIATCVGSSVVCGTLDSLATADGTITSVKPSETATVAINIAPHPGVDATTLYSLASAKPQFAPALTAPPNDFTVALNFTGGSMNFPSGIAIDIAGSAWIANYIASIVELSNSGSVLSAKGGYTGGGIDEPRPS